MTGRLDHAEPSANAAGRGVIGDGPPLLLLPAMSSISTRREMTPLAERLAAGFQVTAIDWPGFGDAPRARQDWSPATMARCLAETIETVAPRAVVAAGHAAGYVAAYAAANPGRIAKLVFLAPTWRGPLPTMMNGPRPWFGRLRAAMDLPVVGLALYRLNVSGPVLRMMAREHVYQDADWLTEARLADKRAVTRARGARHASVRFVTGALDPFDSREKFLDATARAGVPVLLLYGEGTPRRSRAEMEALAALPNVTTRVLPQGRLALHEEFPEPVAEAVEAFLASG